MVRKLVSTNKMSLLASWLPALAPDLMVTCETGSAFWTSPRMSTMVPGSVCSMRSMLTNWYCTFGASASLTGVNCVSRPKVTSQSLLHWLYWRLTGLRYSRSLGQRMFGIAVLAEDGSAMTSQMWDQRAWRKLVFLIPILNIIQGVRELARISQRHTHQSNIDLHVGSIVAHADSLPPANRKHIK